MTLAALLATYDDAALTAVASKGLLVRAGKDVANGNVTLVSQDADTATLKVLTETVVLHAKSIEAARCPCPATGVCRHIVGAVLFLRDQSDNSVHEPLAPTYFAFEEVEKFAGTDWANACALAEQVKIPDTSGSIVATFTESDAQVTFPQGRPLREAIYKGQVAVHKRRFIAAAALGIAQLHGATLPEVVAAVHKPTADPEILDRIAEALELAAVSLSAGTFAQAQTLLLNMAINSRAEAIPRVAAELRGLSQRMSQDALRQAALTPTDVLGGISRTYALVEALRVSPDDPALVGILARSFVPSGKKMLAFLGAETWVTPSGAKGLSIHFCDRESGIIHRATHARAAGTDLQFDPKNQWRTPLWSLCKPSEMAGKTIVLDDAAIAGDGGLGLNQKASFGPDLDLDRIPNIQTLWAKAFELAQQQVGEGLRRRAGDGLIVFAPTRPAALSFDAYAQKTVWDWEDADGQSVTLELPQAYGTEHNLSALTRRIKAGLIAIPPGGGRGRLISIWIDHTTLGPISLGLDPLPTIKGLGAVMDRFMERATSRAQSQIAPLDPLALYFERASEAVINGISGKAGLSPSLLSDAQALGLGHIIDADEAWSRTAKVPEALRLGYLLSTGRDMARGET